MNYNPAVCLAVVAEYLPPVNKIGVILIVDKRFVIPTIFLLYRSKLFGGGVNHYCWQVAEIRTRFKICNKTGIAIYGLFLT